MSSYCVYRKCVYWNHSNLEIHVCPEFNLETSLEANFFSLQWDFSYNTSISGAMVIHFGQ